MASISQLEDGTSLQNAEFSVEEPETEILPQLDPSMATEEEPWSPPGLHEAQDMLTAAEEKFQAAEKLKRDRAQNTIDFETNVRAQLLATLEASPEYQQANAFFHDQKLHWLIAAQWQTWNIKTKVTRLEPNPNPGWFGPKTKSVSDIVDAPETRAIKVVYPKPAVDFVRSLDLHALYTLPDGNSRRILRVFSWETGHNQLILLSTVVPDKPDFEKWPVEKLIPTLYVDLQARRNEKWNWPQSLPWKISLSTEDEEFPKSNMTISYGCNDLSNGVQNNLFILFEFTRNGITEISERYYGEAAAENLKIFLAERLRENGVNKLKPEWQPKVKRDEPMTE